jgi:hypothetical protein
VRRPARPTPPPQPPPTEPPPSGPAAEQTRSERSASPASPAHFAAQPATAGATARAAVRAERRRTARRDPVSRSAEFTGAALALLLVALGGLLELVFSGAPQGYLGAAAGLIVAGIAMDIYARGLGAWAARDHTALAVILAVIGSPAVLWHALARRRGRLAPEPGAIAGLLVPVLLVVFFWAQASA